MGTTAANRRPLRCVARIVASAVAARGGESSRAPIALKTTPAPSPEPSLRPSRARRTELPPPPPVAFTNLRQGPPGTFGRIPATTARGR